MEDQNNKILAAIDIGTTKIVALAGKKDENEKFEILGISSSPSYGVKRGLVMNIEETVSAIKQTADEMQEQAGSVIDEVVVGIAGQHVRSVKNTIKSTINSNNGTVHENDVIRMIQKMYNSQVGAGEQIIHVIPQNYQLDGKDKITDPVGWFAKEMQGVFNIVVGKTNSMENIKNCIRRAELDVKKLMLEPLASADAVLSKKEREMGVAIVDIGGGTTDVAVFKNEVLQHTAVIPFGGSSVTSDIKQTFSVLQAQAEELKIQHGTAIQSKTQKDVIIQVPGLKGREARSIALNDLVYVIQERMKEIIYAVKFQLERSGYLELLNGGVVLTGGGSLLKNLPQLVSLIINKDVIIGYPRERIKGNRAKDVNNPMYSTAVGLLMKYDMLLNNDSPEWDEDILNRTIEAAEENEEKEEKPEKKEKGSIFNKMKSKIKGILDEEEENDLDND